MSRRRSRYRSCGWQSVSGSLRWCAGEPDLNEELSEARWIEPAELARLPTTPGLAEIVAAAFAQLRAAG